MTKLGVTRHDSWTYAYRPETEEDEQEYAEIRLGHGLPHEVGMEREQRAGNAEERGVGLTAAQVHVPDGSRWRRGA